LMKLYIPMGRFARLVMIAFDFTLRY
jgi:hypothetical protein